MVHTNSEQTYTGELKSFDQKLNLMLVNCKLKAEDKETDLGGFLIRGDEIAFVGEIDATLENIS